VSSATNSFYNQFSLFYPLVDVFLRPQKIVLCKEVNQLPKGDLLDIGVGNGAHVQHYKKHTITGIDTSLAMLKIARRRNPATVQLLEMNGEALLFQEEQFDYVVLSHVIAVVDNPEQLLAEVFRVLRPNGRVFILNHFTPNNWLKHLDQAFGRIAKLLHFRSLFHLHEIRAISRFTLLKDIPVDSLSYFKLLIYQKK
jgi:phosphatidylethanolamine/phosphatidyl-N-methylethanolamine N-methyltransferase